MQNNLKKINPKELKKINFIYSVYSDIKNGESIGYIASKNNMSLPSLSYHLKYLKEGKMIEKIAYCAWAVIGPFNYYKIKELKKNQPMTVAYQPKEVRGHGFMFKLQLPKIPNWHKRKTYLDTQGVKNDNIHSGGQKIIVNEKIVHLFSKSVIIYDKLSYITKLANASKSLAVYHFLKIVKKIESLFNLSFKVNKMHKFKVLKEHYGLMKNCLARQYNEEGNKLYVYNTQGLWLMIDNSFNLHEAEVQRNREVSENQAINDTDGMQNYFNSHKRTGFKVTPEFILEGMHKVTQNQMIFDNNMKTHLEVLKDLGNAVNDLRKELKKNQKV